MEYLLFRLYGPLASWGDIAVGESRHSHPFPTKTAVLGLVAAALGINREQESLHQTLNEKTSMACAVLNEGDLLRDYHSVQAPDAVGKFRYSTRRDELIVGRDRLGTLLSSRDYRTDACVLVALRVSQGAPYTLDQMAYALKEPRYLLYLGRKSCPLGAPLQPEVIQANHFSEVFTKYSPSRISAERSVRYADQVDGHREWVDYYWEGSVEDFGPSEKIDTSQLMKLSRHDRLISRKRWQYGANAIYRYRSVEGR